jgi:hypothetical protein
LKVSCQPQLASILGDLILSYLDNNLLLHAQGSQINEEEEENFEKEQRTTKNDDLDFFSKLMRQKSEFALEKLLERFN